MVNILKKYYIDCLLLLMLLIPASYLRFKDISYSDYIGDEQKSFIRLSPDENLFEFLMDQRKGPMQFIVSSIPFSITGDYRNHLAQRLPYALLSISSIIALYLLVMKMTQSRVAAFFSCAFYSANGFFVGFGRISQYQNINLLFSFLSLYFAWDLISKKIHIIRSALISVLCFTISFYAHWDAVFILPVMLSVGLLFIKRKDIDKKYKVIVIRNILITLSILIMPYMVPYIYYQSVNRANQEYFSRRVAPGFTDISYFKFLIDLYNPFITFWFLSVTSILGLFRFKKSWILLIWFIPTFFIFWYFFRKPGTHIYNFILPVIILSGLGVSNIVSLLPKWFKWLPILIILPICIFFYFQSYVFFVDHKKEYPWEQKQLYKISAVNKGKYGKIGDMFYNLFTTQTPVYSIEQKLPLFGFPHKRYWNEINAYVNEQNNLNGETFTYETNEDKSVSEFYMDVDYGSKSGFYGVGIKRPTNFVSDWSYKQYGNRELVKEFGTTTTVVRIYRIIPKTSIQVR